MMRNTYNFHRNASTSAIRIPRGAGNNRGARLAITEVHIQLQLSSSKNTKYNYEDDMRYGITYQRRKKP